MGEEMAGTLTFVFTDIEGSTRRWQQYGDAMRSALERHDALVADVVEGAGGRIFKHTGDGVCAAFPSCGAAVAAAIEIERRLTTDGEVWKQVGGLAVRIGVHTGESEARDGDFFGPTLNRTARIMDAAHGGQILTSNAAAALVFTGDGLPPGVRLVDLGEHALRDLDHPERLHQVVAPGLPAEFPPPRTGAGGRTAGDVATATHVPVARTSFVGRAQEIETVAALLNEAPVVTLVGIGGTGKTRLAIEVVTHVQEAYDGVCFVDLSPVTDGAQIAATIAAALGIGTAGPATGPVLDTVTAALSTRRRLVVLDNCEHLVDDCAEIVDVLLDACPDLTILATSREALAVEGERAWPVASLPLDDAIALFGARATSADPRFRADESAEAVAEICRRLDGIPLAIELAASRVGHLSPEELAARLDDRFRLLTGGRHRRAQRQQTLQAAVDWSYDLLDDDERALLRRLSVFTGNFTLETVERVCAGDDVALRGSRVVDVLGALVSKSLVLAERPSVPGATRYRLLETIRLYATERLVEAREVEIFRDRNRDWWLEWMRRPSLDDLMTRTDVLERVDAELENLRAAIDWSEASGHVDVATEIATRMGGLWALLGHHEEGLTRLASLASSEELTDDAWRARCLAALSQVAMTIGDFARMGDVAARSLALEPEGPLAPVALVYAALALVFDFDRYPDAHALLDEARRVADLRAAPRLHDLTDALEAHFFVVEGRLDRVAEIADAMTPYPSSAEVNVRLASYAGAILQGEPRRAIEQAGILGASYGQGWEHVPLGLARLELGDRSGAEAAIRTGAAEYLARPYPLVLADCLVAFAALALHDGDAARCVTLLSAAMAERGLASFRSPAIAMLAWRYRRQAKTALAADDYAAASAAGRAAGPLALFHAEVERGG